MQESFTDASVAATAILCMILDNISMSNGIFISSAFASI